jgi:hypothetical protein
MRHESNHAIERRARLEYESEIERLARETAGLPSDAVDIIRERLQFSARLIERTTGRVRPKEYGSAWPPMLREFADLVAQEEAQEGDREREHNRIILQPTARQITQAEEALAWRRYVTEAQALAALNIWLRCKALRLRSWQKEAVRRGFSRETAKRRLARAFFLIAVGLSRDGKPIEPVTR